jgi:oligopeptide transport system permease protein
MSDLTVPPPLGLPGDPAEPMAVGLSPFRASLRRFSKNHLAVVSIFVLAVIALACFFGPMFYPADTELGDFDNISAPIDFFNIHPFGTDDQGRDLLYRVLTGGRLSLTLGFFGSTTS